MYRGKKLLSLRFGVGRGLQTLRATRDDPEYIQKSRIPSYHFQKSMPRLPIPKLEDTLPKYLSIVEPVLEAAEFEKTKNLVKQFGTEEGPKLHQELLAMDNANKHTSFISQPWYDMYLASRDPVAINVNPFLVLPLNQDLVNKAGDRKQSLRAAQCVNSSLRFMRSLQDNLLVPEIWHMDPKKSCTPFFETVAKMIPSSLSYYWAYFNQAYPLDMYQYQYLFGTTRIPKVGKDELLTTKSKHIIVSFRGHLYPVNVFKPNGRIPLSVAELEGIFQHILKSNVAPATHPIGVLTSENRDVWAKAREQLIVEGNKEALNQIETALFALCLDDRTEPSIEGKAYQFLCDGTNRWYDKSFMLIISDTSDTCINFEHSWGDGVAVLRYLQDMRADAEHPRPILPAEKPFEIPQPLNWSLSDSLKTTIKTAHERLVKQTKSLDFKVSIFNGYGKNYLKSKGISPDGVAQMAFQLAFYTTHKTTTGTYESASTAGFLHGRTETVRPCSVESKEFVNLMVKGADKETCNAALRTATQVHSKRTKEALMGQGVDRHLFALKFMAQKHGNVPAIFQDPAYARINHIRISTSTLSTDAIAIGGFGPVAPDGYGLGYYVSPSEIQVGCSSYIGSRDMLQNLENAFGAIGKVLE